jgi:hypothetical protein
MSEELDHYILKQNVQLFKLASGILIMGEVEKTWDTVITIKYPVRLEWQDGEKKGHSVFKMDIDSIDMDIASIQSMTPATFPYKKQHFQYALLKKLNEIGLTTDELTAPSKTVSRKFTSIPEFVEYLNVTQPDPSRN